MMELDRAVVSLLMWETCGGTVAQKALTGTATLRHGLKSDGTSSLEQCEYNVALL